MIRHPIYGLGVPTGRRNGVFMQVRFINPISPHILTNRPNTLWVSANVCGEYTGTHHLDPSR